MCRYKEILCLKKEDVGSPVKDFLVDAGQEQIAREWTIIGYGTRVVDIDIDNISDKDIEAHKNKTVAITQSNLLSKILSEFVAKAKAKSSKK